MVNSQDTPPTHTHNKDMNINSVIRWTTHLINNSFKVFSILFNCLWLASEWSPSLCYQFNSPAVSSLLDMDLDSFTFTVTQVNHL